MSITSNHDDLAHEATQDDAPIEGSPLRVSVLLPPDAGAEFEALAVEQAFREVAPHTRPGEGYVLSYKWRVNTITGERLLKLRARKVVMGEQAQA